MEACATSHYWARELTKLGHQVRLMPAKDVKAYLKRNKNDAADAEAICEAADFAIMHNAHVCRMWSANGHWQTGKDFNEHQLQVLLLWLETRKHALLSFKAGLRTKVIA